MGCYILICWENMFLNLFKVPPNQKGCFVKTLFSIFLLTNDLFFEKAYNFLYHNSTLHICDFCLYIFFVIFISFVIDFHLIIVCTIFALLIDSCIIYW